MRGEDISGPRLVYSSCTHGRARERWPKQLSLLRLSMNALGVRMMRLEYDGRDGDGEFLPPRLMDNEFHEITATLKEEFVLQLAEFFGHLLETRYAQWTAGMGACGDFGIDFKLGTVTHVHRRRVMDYETTRHHGFADDSPDVC